MARTGRPTTVGGKQRKVMFGEELDPEIESWQAEQGMESFSEAARDLVAHGLKRVRGE